MGESASHYEPTSTINLGLRSISQKTSLDNLTSEELSVISKLDPNHAMLIIHRGPNKGERFLLENSEITIGRAVDNEIFLDDITVSRKHARIMHTENNFEVQDLSSLNGTYLNNKSVAKAMLKHGDEVQFGKFHMLFVQNPGVNK